MALPYATVNQVEKIVNQVINSGDISATPEQVYLVTTYTLNELAMQTLDITRVSGVSGEAQGESFHINTLKEVYKLNLYDIWSRLTNCTGVLKINLGGELGGETSEFIIEDSSVASFNKFKDEFIEEAMAKGRDETNAKVDFAWLLALVVNDNISSDNLFVIIPDVYDVIYYSEDPVEWQDDTWNLFESDKITVGYNEYDWSFDIFNGHWPSLQYKGAFDLKGNSKDTLNYASFDINFTTKLEEVNFDGIDLYVAPHHEPVE